MAEKFFRIRKGLAVNTASPSVTVHISSNDAILVPVGNTAERPSGANGMFRYNSDINKFEGYANSAWDKVGAGGGYYKGNLGAIGDSPNANNLYKINGNTQSANVTLVAGENTVIAGPLSIANGTSLTIEAGARLVVV